MSLSPAGDAMDVGEKDVTSSGGQKARIKLTRALYSDKEVLLLDNVFFALDSVKFSPIFLLEILS